ncbi:MAG: acylphosphatase [Bacteroidota bacterium]|nr:acylphosphatase [Bacteroidota bacterium]
MKTVHLYITGKVQGVFFRAKAKEVAYKYEITGWIKNTANGKVEAMIYGQANKVDEFIEWCRIGPERAKVEEVIISNLPEIKFDDFEVIEWE